MTSSPGLTPDDELEVHLAMVAWFEDRRANGEELLTFRELHKGLNWKGLHIPLIAQSQGIWKPASLSAALTFKTTARQPGDTPPYEDRISEDGTLHYKMAATRDKAWTNQAMLLAAERGYPLAWLVGVKPAETLYYYARFPVYVTGVDEDRRAFFVAVDGDPEMPTDLGRVRTVAEQGRKRRYASRWTRQRLHQQAFREEVIAAYEMSCAICDMPHIQLLEAAHIVVDSKDEGIPVVANGLALCNTHHRAYDSHLIGIDESLRIHVANRAFAIEQNTERAPLSAFAGKLLTHVPAAPSLRPEGWRLQRHFREFTRLNETA